MLKKNGWTRLRKTGTCGFSMLLLFSMIMACTLEPEIGDMLQEVIEANTKSCTVSFSTGTGGDVVPAQTVAKGGKVKAPADPANTAGDTFNGWYKEPAHTHPWDFASDTVSNSITLYAKWVDPATSFTVTFDNDGGDKEASPMTKSVVSPADKIDALPTPPVKAGYTFGGWWTATSGGGTVFTAATTVTGNITVYAKWMRTVTFDSQGATTAAGPSAIEVILPDTTVGSLPTPPVKTGYTFEGWFTQRSGAGTEFEDTTTVTGNITVYAKWTTTVTFDSQSATTAASPATRTVVYPATTVSALPTPPVKTGYAFGGWWTAVSGGGTAFTAATAVTGNITVYAKWTATVTFNGQGATTAASPATKSVVFPDNTIDALPTPPVRTGYTFGGWWTDTNGGGTEFDDVTTVTGSITVYAKWTVIVPVDYTVTFHNNYLGATEPFKTETKVSGSTVALPSPAPTRSGYTLDKWYDAPTGGSAITFPATITGDTDFYAQWKPNLVSIAVTGGPDTTTYDEGDALDLTGLVVTATYTGGGTVVITPTTTSPASGAALNTTGTVTVNVSYTEGGITQTTTFNITVNATGPTNYTVTFNNNYSGATEPFKTETIASGSTVALPVPAPTRSGSGGYTFDAWYDAPTGGSAVTFPYTVTANKSFYARWTATEVILDGGLGTAGNTKITGLTAGMYYKVLVGATSPVLRYVTSGGTLTATDDLGLIGPMPAAGEITGLTNGQTYKVIKADALTGPLYIFDHPAPSYAVEYYGQEAISSGVLTLDQSGVAVWAIDLALPVSKTYEIMKLNGISEDSPMWVTWLSSKLSGAYVSDGIYTETDPGLYIHSGAQAAMDFAHLTQFIDSTIVYAPVHDTGEVTYVIRATDDSVFYYITIEIL